MTEEVTRIIVANAEAPWPPVSMGPTAMLASRAQPSPKTRRSSNTLKPTSPFSTGPGPSLLTLRSRTVARFFQGVVLHRTQGRCESTRCVHSKGEEIIDDSTMASGRSNLKIPSLEQRPSVCIALSGQLASARCAHWLALALRAMLTSPKVLDDHDTGLKARMRSQRPQCTRQLSKPFTLLHLGSSVASACPRTVSGHGSPFVDGPGCPDCPSNHTWFVCLSCENSSLAESGGLWVFT